MLYELAMVMLTAKLIEDTELKRLAEMEKELAERKARKVRGEQTPAEKGLEAAIKGFGRKSAKNDPR